MDLAEVIAALVAFVPAAALVLAARQALSEVRKNSEVNAADRRLVNAYMRTHTVGGDRETAASQPLIVGAQVGPKGTLSRDLVDALETQAGAIDKLSESSARK